MIFLALHVTITPNCIQHVKPKKVAEKQEPKFAVNAGDLYEHAILRVNV